MTQRSRSYKLDNATKKIEMAGIVVQDKSGEAVTSVSNVASVKSTGNITTSGYFLGNGTLITGVATASELSTANVNLKGYSDSTFQTQSSATTANTNVVGYVDSEITTVTSAIGTANTNLKGYTDGEITTVTSAIGTANTNMQGYVDNEISSLIDSAPGTLDTLNEIAAALGDDPNLATTLTNTITTANTNMKGYVDGQVSTLNSSITTANTNVVGYVDSAVSTANVNLKGYADATFLTPTGDGSQLTGIVATADPAGANTHVQFNDGGATGADSRLTYNKATNTLSVGSFIGDGSQLTGLPAGYADSDVDAHLSGGTGITYSSGTISVNASQTQITAVGTLTGLTAAGAGSTYLRVTSSNAGSGSGLYTQNATNSYYIGAGAASGGSSLEFRDNTNSATRMVINSTGNVGIGTTSPGGKLDISVPSGYYGSSNPILNTQYNSIQTFKMYMDANWYTHLVSVLVSEQTNGLAFDTNGAERMRITSTGAVGIGKTNPATPLDVNGTVTATALTSTTATVGGILLEDSSDRSGLLEVNRLGATAWTGFQAKFSATALWSFMGNETQFGLYDDANSKWAVLCAENAGVSLYYNNAVKLQTTNAGVTLTGVMTGTASAARYADLAEKYVADADYEPGTVVVFGGEKEVTISTEDYDPRVAGVVSTNPGYMMNNDLEAEYVAAVALQGRVPCKVYGTVAKGDRLVTSSKYPGCAVSMTGGYVPNAYQPGTIIGKALEDIHECVPDSMVKIIEVVVGRV
jgi:hypothetical protein